MPIQRLAEAVISMIAAGEVVERPASALKELLENSIDGGASNITADLSPDTHTRMLVKDDGQGIMADDLILAVQPHATSKLSTATDLESIKTLGFRGEALASIAALSNLVIKSRHQNMEQGSKLKLSGSWSKEKVRQCVMNYGTEILVQDLFVHAPARRKFLRKPATEWAQCESVFRSIAIGNPDISFTLMRNGKQRLSFPKQNHKQRTFDILGKKFAETAQPVSASLGPLRLHGFVNVAGPASPERQYLYLNGRNINDRILRQAVRKAFTDVAREASIPYALFIEVPGQAIDVNAHPAKMEVRFREPHAIFSFVYGALTKIANQPLGINPDIPITANFTPNPGADSQWTSPSTAPRNHQESFIGGSNANVASAIAALSRYNSSASDKPLPGVLDTPQASEDTKTPVSLGRAIGVLHGIYLLSENESGMVVIDIHAAHERILYEEFKDQTNTKKIQVQKLIHKIELGLSPQALDAVVNYRAKLADEGFYVRNTEGVESLEAIPAYLSSHLADPAKLAIEAIEELATIGEAFSPTQLRNQLLSTAACHAAVRGANTHFKLSDLDKLLRRMEKTLNSGKCNHGRFTWRVLRLQALDQSFERHQ